MKLKIIKMNMILALTCASLMISCVPEDSMPVKVNVGYLPMVSSLTYFVATENGYFTGEGIDIQARAITKSDEIALDLINGNIDIAIELSITPLLKNEKMTPENIPYKIFSTSTITHENGFDSVLAKESSAYKDLGDLSGKKIAVFPGTTSTNTIKAYFNKNFPDVKLPEFVTTIPLAQQLTALARGEVDAIHAYEPALTIGIQKFGYKRISSSLYANQLSPCPIGVAAINRKFYADHPDVAKKIIKALDQAAVYIEKNPGHARAILAKYTGASPAIADEMNIMPMSEHNRIDSNNLDGYLKILRMIGENKTNLQAKDLILAL